MHEIGFKCIDGWLVIFLHFDEMYIQWLNVIWMSNVFGSFSMALGICYFILRNCCKLIWEHRNFCNLVLEFFGCNFSAIFEEIRVSVHLQRWTGRPVLLTGQPVNPWTLIFARFVAVDRIVKPIDRFVTEPPKLSVPCPPFVTYAPRRLAAVCRRRLLQPPHNPLTKIELYETLI